MEKFQTAMDNARKDIRVADHMLVITYPMIKDSKLLITILGKIYAGMVNSMTALLLYERKFKRAPPFHDNYQSKLLMYTECCETNYKIDVKFRKNMNELRDLMDFHKKSPMEFSKGEKMVMLSEESKPKVIQPMELKKFVKMAKEFLNKVESIIKENESVFDASVQRA